MSLSHMVGYDTPCYARYAAMLMLMLIADAGDMMLLIARY